MTTINLHEVFVLIRINGNGDYRGVIGVYENCDEAMQHAKKIHETYGGKFKIEKTNFFGALPK